MLGLIMIAVVLITFFISSFNLRKLVDALFLEGATLLSMGGILAAGLPQLSLFKFTRETAAQSRGPGAAQEEGSRRRNTRIGFALMLVGLVLIILCIGVGELILR
jgi:hypothetical protein